MNKRVKRLLAITPLTMSLLGAIGASPASASYVHPMCGFSYALYHNGHYDSMTLIDHYNTAHTRGHVHVWHEDIHDVYSTMSNCPLH